MHWRQKTVTTAFPTTTPFFIFIGFCCSCNSAESAKSLGWTQGEGREPLSLLRDFLKETQMQVGLGWEGWHDSCLWVEALYAHRDAAQAPCWFQLCSGPGARAPRALDAQGASGRPSWIFQMLVLGVFPKYPGF